ncbi:MAG: ADP-ribosylglycohydrolase family protein [Abditibacteriota bacterium]|nr:ADP-ribosylglycohydrolase family protein [Abditibacteriota bacterium]
MNKDKFRGCLVGGAAGDALGYMVEFLTEERIFALLGEGGIREFALNDGKALISDDTQMTLFTASALLREGDIIANIADAYRLWRITQTEKFTGKEYDEPLMSVRELWNRRAPGNTCMTAIRDGCKGTMDNPINKSKGCGGVMRVAPIGLAGFDDMVGAKAAALTHGHELGYIPAACLVHMVRCLAREDMPLRDAVEEAITAASLMFANKKHTGYFVDLTEKAMDLADSDTPDIDAIHTLGEGWVAEETLAIAVFCALRYENDFEKALIAAVNHNGDSDSTGAVCGNILGAHLGLDAVPQKFKDNLELYDLYIDLGTKLADLP